MYPPQFLIFCQLCFVYAVDFGYPLNSFNIVDGKRTMLLSKRPNDTLQREIDGAKKKCKYLIPKRSHKTATFYIDFGEQYPVVLLRIVGFNGKKISPVSKVVVSVDDKICALFLLTDGLNSITCVTPLVGRLLRVETLQSDVLLCSVEVYTCAVGRRGPECGEVCQPGRYGLACTLPCSCSGNLSCTPESGHCPTGCRDSYSNGMYDCYFGHPRPVHNNQFYNIAPLATGILNSGNQPVSRYIIKKPIDFALKKHLGFNECVDLKTEPHDNSSVVLNITFDSSQLLHSVIVNYSKFDIPPPYSIHVTINGKSCFGNTIHSRSLLTTPLPLVCQRRGVKGREIIIRFISHDLKTRTENLITLAICQIQIMVCSRGFYGPSCNIQCNCFGTLCDPITGECMGKKCNRFSRGRNCASVDISPMHQVGDGHGKSLRATGQQKEVVNVLEEHAPLPRVDNELWHSTSTSVNWWFIQLDAVYKIHGMTLHVKDQFVPSFRVFAIFTDIDFKTNTFLDLSTHSWQGLGCMRDTGQLLAASMDITCSAQANSITVVTYGDVFDIDMAIEDLQVWACIDGTFGPRCEGVCNCKLPTEFCDKVTGACISGCPEGFSGVDCQTPCTVEELNTECWTKCRCQDRRRGCGPGLVICDGQCLSGWMGVKCDLPCPEGWYGPGCTEPCGDCFLMSEDHKTCNPETGHCIHGCAHVAASPTCKIPPSDGDYHLARADGEPDDMARDDAIKIIAIGMVTCAMAAAVICMCLRLCWLNYIDKPPEERRFTGFSVNVRRLLSHDVDTEILRGHRVYHEKYAQRELLRKANSDAKRMKEIRGTQAAQKRRTRATPTDEGRCKPLQDNTQQDTENRVALWILAQDFDFLINRRKDRLKHYKGDILQIQESTYAISEINISPASLQQLYDDVGRLGIP